MQICSGNIPTFNACFEEGIPAENGDGWALPGAAQTDFNGFAGNVLRGALENLPWK